MNNRQLFLHSLAQTSPFPLSLEITNAEGIHLIDINDKKYVDLISGIGVSIIGHCNPTVIEAINQQAKRYMHTMVYGEHILSPQLQLASFLTSKLPPDMDNVYLVNSGTEAVEGALKLAKKYTGRHEIIAFKNAYHGSTAGAAALMSDATFTAVSAPHVPGAKFIDFNDHSQLDRITEKTAAVVCEIIKAEAGVIPGNKEFITNLRKRCFETGTLLIVDEIQTGCGRTGSWFAFQQMDIVPDILLLAKGFGGGLPLGAFIAGKKIMRVLSEKPILSHITTFGGNPVCCASSLATLKYIEENNLVESVAARSSIIDKVFTGYTIRKSGLLAAIQLNSFDEVHKVCMSCMADGVLIDWFLFNDSSIRLAPPLTISESELENSLTIVKKNIEKL